MNRLPKNMVDCIRKATDCKRLTGTAECSPTCPMGYDGTIAGEHFQKCRTNCFLFDVTDENIPYIKEFVEHELAAAKGR